MLARLAINLIVIRQASDAGRELAAPAQRLGVSTSTVALAWLLRRSSAIIPIPGTKSLEHLRDNVAALEVAAELTAKEVAHLTGVIDESGRRRTNSPRSRRR